MSKKLIVHAGGRLVDYQQVIDAETPQATDTYVPIAHTTLVDMMKSRLSAYNFNIRSEEHALMGGSYFGLFEIAGSDGAMHDDYSLVIGLRNCHEKKFPAGMVVGSKVFVCDNRAFSGEVKWGRRHTKYIERDLPLLTDKAFGRLLTARVQQEERIKAYKETEISNMVAHNAFIEMFRGGAINSTRISKAVQEWHNPSHAEFKEPTAWRLMQAVTEVSKGLNPFELSTRTLKMHAILDGIVDYQPTVAQEDDLDDVIDAEFVAV